MHGLKKTGITIVAGSLIGASATVALGASELYGVGDMGSFFSSTPDGNADGVYINTLFNTVDILYMENNGLNVRDTSGQLVDILVTNAGTGYGDNINGEAAVLRWVNNESPLDVLDEWVYDNGWYVWANINNNGTGGTGGSGFYELDGPAGGYFYGGSATRYDINAPNARYYNGESLGMIRITNGGTGYAVGRNNVNEPVSGNALKNYNRETSLRVLVDSLGGNIGSFGIVQSTDADAGNLDPSAESPRDPFVRISGLQPGGEAAELASGGGIQVAGVANVENTNSEMWIFNDNSSQPGAENDAWGNFRLYLGHNQPPANGNLEGLPGGTDVASAAGEVCALNIVQNSTDNTNVNANGTSGIGYTAGDFRIYDAAGDLVTGVTISYDVDAEGRIYTDALGGFFTGPIRDIGGFGLNQNVSQVTGGPLDPANDTRQVNCTSGYQITNKGSGFHSTAGWTVEPSNANGGFGFDCRGVHLWGQIINLPYMACQTNGTDSWNVVTEPIITVDAGGAGTPALPAAADVFEYSTEPVPTGAIVDGYVLTAGQSYRDVTTSWITTQAGDTGTLGTLEGVIGAVGRRTITMAGEDVSTDLFNNGFKCYMNGDFNGDGYSDLVWHSDTAEVTAIWNMGPEGTIKSAGFLSPEGMGPGWSFGGIGKFGYSGTGCCVFWHNIFDGQTAVWVVDSSFASEADWVVGGVFLDTVELLSNTPRTTNNVVQNGGTGVYWQDELIGQLAYWPIAINSNISGFSLDGAGFVTLNGAELLFPFDFGINLAAVGNMAGRPVSDGVSSLRDIVSVNDITGETLVWLMSSDHTSIDTSAVGNTGASGGGYTTRMGLVTFDNFYNFEGIGQYDELVIYALPPAGGFLPGGAFRHQWFANLFWSLPDAGANFSWKMDRNIDLLDYTVTPAAPTGTGLSVDPYEIWGTAPLD